MSGLFCLNTFLCAQKKVNCVITFLMSLFVPKQYRNIFRTFFTYNRADRNAIIILATLVVLAFIASIVVRFFDFSNGEISPEMRAIIKEWNSQKQEEVYFAERKLFEFNPNLITKESLDSLDLPTQVKFNLIKYREAGGSFKNREDFRKLYGVTDSLYYAVHSFILVPQPLVHEEPKKKPRPVLKPVGYFDPNTASQKRLESFGFNSFQINNLIAYRETEGVFRKPEDLCKIYGIDSTFYFELIPFIKIEKTETPEVRETYSVDVVELNSCDTLELIQLPGIGPVYANRIIKYRNLLGGFYNKKQLLEVYNFPQETFDLIQDKLSVDTLAIQQMRINFAEYVELVRHPYLTPETVKVILKVREQNGMFKDIDELKRIEGVDSELFNKIQPYVTCR